VSLALGAVQALGDCVDATEAADDADLLAVTPLSPAALLPLVLSVPCAVGFFLSDPGAAKPGACDANSAKIIRGKRTPEGSIWAPCIVLFLIRLNVLLKILFITLLTYLLSHIFDH
jgi:hypothetical protein